MTKALLKSAAAMIGMAGTTALTKHKSGLIMPAAPKAPVRGVIGGARADMTASEIFAKLKNTMEEFRNGVNEELKEIKNGQEDFVTADKVNKMNETVSNLEKALNDSNAMLARIQAGQTMGDGAENPDVKAHTDAFLNFFAKGREETSEGSLRELEMKAALSTDSDRDGGYVVPTEMEKTIDQIARSISVMRNLANVVQVGSDEYKKMVNVGGAGAGWVGEKEKRDETGTPQMVAMTYAMKELYANPAATQRMLDDGTIINVAQWLGEEVMISFDELEAESFINGDGVDQPRGLWDYPIISNDGYSAKDNWGKFGYVPTGKADGFKAPTASVSPADCLIDLVYGLKQQFRQNGRFLMNDKTAMTVRKFKNNDGDFIWQDPTSSERVPTILGKEVSTDDYTPVVAANAFPIAFGNFKRTYSIFDRIGIRILRDPYSNKPYVHFYTTKRVGGGVTHFQTMKFLKVATS